MAKAQHALRETRTSENDEIAWLNNNKTPAPCLPLLPQHPNITSWDTLVHLEKSQIHEHMLRYLQCISGLHRLADGQWLDDNIIDGYLDLVHRKWPQSAMDMQLNTYFGASTLFAWSRYSARKNDAWFRSVVRGTDVKKLIEYGVCEQTPHVMRFKHVLFPVLVNKNHWVLFQISPRRKLIWVHDSLAISTSDTKEIQEICDRVMFWAVEQHKILYGLATPARNKPALYDSHGWAFAPSRSDLPKQLNLNDCGVFVCLYARYIAADKTFDFDQGNMGHMRVAMLIEVLSYSLFSL